MIKDRFPADTLKFSFIYFEYEARKIGRESVKRGKDFNW